jgi:hypothetical protein
MATRAATKKAAKKKVAKKSPPKTGVISFQAAKGLSPKQIKVFNLKKGRKDLTVDELVEILKEASRSKVGYVVLNAPFKLSQASKSFRQST